MLSDTSIEQAIIEWKGQNNPAKGISIEPFDKKYLTPVGYDLRVGKEGFSWKKKCVINIEKDGKIQIDAKDTVVIRTLESVSLSKSFSATIHSMVSKIITKGFSDISTTIDPGWSGKLLVSLHNYRDNVAELRFQESFCTVCFYEVKPESQGNLDRPSDRDDLWDQLLSIASQEENRITAQKRQEEGNIKNENKNRKLLLFFGIIIVLIVGGVASFKNPTVGSSIATFLAFIAPWVYDNFLKPISKP